MRNRKLLSGILAVLLSLCMVTSACSTAWINVAIQDLPILVQIVTSIFGIVGAAQGRGQVDPAVASQIQAVANQVKADLQLVQSLVDSYKAADTATKPGILSKIDSALVAVQNNLNALLSASHVSNPALQATITASIGLAITTVLAIQSLMPSAAVKGIKAQSKPMSAGQLRDSFNGIVASNGYGEFAIH